MRMRIQYLLLVAAVFSIWELSESAPERIVVRQNIDRTAYHSTYIYSNNTPPFEISARPFMAVQRLRETDPPNRWVDLVLCDDEGVDNATLSFTDDNGYLLGFKNRKGSWHALPKFVHLFPDSHALPLGEKYKDLVGPGGRKNLVNVPLGKSSARWAMKALSQYPSVSSVEDVKSAMARCILMYSEALRFHPVRDSFDQEDVFLEEKTVELLVMWGEICTLLIDWEMSGRVSWGDRRRVRLVQRASALGIRGPLEAIEVLDLGIRTKAAWQRAMSVLATRHA